MAKSLIDNLRAMFGGSVDEAAPPSPQPDAPLPPQPIAVEWRERIPDSSHDRVVVISNLITELEVGAAERGMQTELDELERIKATHLPRLIQSYVEIPPEHRAEVFRDTGKSASFLLNESLDKMLARLRDISSQLARGNITTFAENVRFVDLYYDDKKSDPFA